MRPWVLALSGKRFSGKDTMGDFLCAKAAEEGVPFARRALADESKEAFALEMIRQGIHVELARLKKDRGYKERWRAALTQFTMEALSKDPLVFL